jgi:hypothetical protein
MSIFNGSAGTIKNCILSSNGGQGLNLDHNANAVVEESQITDNYSDSEDSDGIYLQYGATIEMNNNAITGNAGAGLLLEMNSVAVGEGNTFANNTGGDIESDPSSQVDLSP